MADQPAVLITGGNGFIGRNLVEHLTDSFLVVAPSRQELDLLDLDAVDRFFKSTRIDLVVHSATTPGHRNALPAMDLVERDMRMFAALVRNREHFQKMVFISSGSVYGRHHYQPKMKEEFFGSYIPNDSAGFSKYCCACWSEHVEGIVELRPFGVFGKFEDYAIRFISNAICKVLFGLPITIKQNRKFDFVYITDLVRVIERCLREDVPSQSYNVTPKNSVELNVLAQMVARVSGRDVPILIKEPGMGLEYSGDNSRLRKTFSGIELTTLDKSLAELYAWYYARRHTINRDLLLKDR
ncbi:MAG: NAD(P)-dependent oxidoreductase [Nitrospirales bacterium]